MEAPDGDNGNPAISRLRLVPMRQWSQWCVGIYPTRADLPILARSTLSNLAAKKEDAVAEAKQKIDRILARLNYPYADDLHVVPMRSCRSEVCKKETVMRLFVVVLALAVAASTQAMAFGSHGRMTKKAEVNEGCSAAFYRGSGGNCIHNPGLPQALPSRSVLDTVRLLARPTISRGLWWRLATALEKSPSVSCAFAVR